MKTFLTHVATFFVTVGLTLTGLYYAAKPYLDPYTLSQISDAYDLCQNWTKNFPEGTSRCVLVGGYRLQLKIDPELLKEKPLTPQAPSI